MRECSTRDQSCRSLSALSPQAARRRPSAGCPPHELLLAICRWEYAVRRRGRQRCRQLVHPGSGRSPVDAVRRRPLRPRDARRTLAAFRDAQHVANAARTRVRKINGVRPWLVCPVRPLWTGGDDSDSIRAQRNLGWGLHLVHDATRARNRRRGDHQCLLGRRPRPPSFLGREATLALATSRRNLTSRPFLLSFVQRLIEPRSRYYRCRSSGRPAHRPPPLGRAVSGAHDHPFLAW